MKSTVMLAATLSFALASASPQFAAGGLAARQDVAVGDFVAATADAFRGPCPMMNTLANHGFLPRDGTNITLENAVSALTNGLNFDSDIATIMWQQAVIANPDANATFFTLDNLNRHNILEHDGSLSRSDAFFGNNHIFNSTIFATSTVYWDAATLKASHFANAKISRQLASKAFNPTYRFTETTEAFSLGEMAAPILIFGDIEQGTVDREKVVFFFENEKLPTELGWSKQASPITLERVMAVSASVGKAAELLTVDANTTTTSAARRVKRDLHMGGALF